jgi:hypothetical protein
MKHETRNANDGWDRWSTHQSSKAPMADGGLEAGRYFRCFCMNWMKMGQSVGMVPWPPACMK